MLIIAAESVQGGLRRLLSDPDIEFAIRQVSVLTGAVVIFVITWFAMPWLRIRTATGALGVGLLWVAMTVAFEVGIGLATALEWDRVLSDFDLLHGGMMPVGLLIMALTPWAVRRLQAGRIRDADQSDAGA